MALTHCPPWTLVAVAVVTLIAAATDLRRFKVYNALTFPAFFAGLIAATITGGWAGLGGSLAGAALGFGGLLLFHALGGVGAGDVKLFAAMGAWLGPGATAEVFAASALAAAAYALGLTLFFGGIARVYGEFTDLTARLVSPRSWSRPTRRVEVEVQRSDRRRRLVPFAAMTCVGFFAAAWISREVPASKRAVPVATIGLDRGRDR